MKVLGLIPTRIGSIRLPSKPLLKINNIPLIIHTYKRAKMSKLLDDVIICCDDKKIINIAKKFNSKSILRSKKNRNGTERIYEAYKKLKKKYDLIIDIQGDEPLIDPRHIDSVIKFHKKHKSSDIILPHLRISYGDNNNIVKLLTTKNLWSKKQDMKNQYNIPILILFSVLNIQFSIKSSNCSDVYVTKCSFSLNSSFIPPLRKFFLDFGIARKAPLSITSKTLGWRGRADSPRKRREVCQQADALLFPRGAGRGAGAPEPTRDPRLEILHPGKAQTTPPEHANYFGLIFVDSRT